MKIIAFGASSSKESINQQFAKYAAQQFKDAEIEILDLSLINLPIFSVDLEKQIGHPDEVKNIVSKFKNADLIIISVAEHNGTYTTAFKNLFDWASRVELKMFDNKNMLLLSTSPGPRGGLGALEAAKVRFPIHGAKILAHFSLPKFYENFDTKAGITNTELKNSFSEAIEVMQSNS